MKQKFKFFVLSFFFGQFCFAEVSTLQADTQLVKALCLDKANYGSYSIKQRKEFLNQAVLNFDNLRLHGMNAEVRKDAQLKWEKLQIYIQKNALEGLECGENFRTRSSKFTV